MAATDEIKKRVKRREEMFLLRLFGMLAKMAKADGKVDAWEAHAAEKAFERFPRAAARRKFCIRVFNEAKNSRISLAKMAWEFANKWASPEDCLAVYEILWDIACSTGVLRPVHKCYLECLCRFLHLPESYFDIYYRKRHGEFREWTEEDEKRVREARYRAEAAREEKAHRTSLFQAEYNLLGCSPDASDEELKSAYRAAAKKYHPDLMRARGCSESSISAATVMMAKINAAWEKIKRERGL